jgi:FkbM family methyltransferase
MNIQLNKIEMNINGVGITSFDVPTSMTPYGTREAISFNKFKFDSFPIKDGGHYVEVGSHNGLLGFYVARLFPNINVHLFECNPLMVKAIEYGIITNGLNNVTVYPFGLSDSNRIAEFGVNFQNTGGSSLLIHDGHTKNITVRLYDFETILSTFDFIDYIKIDIEGEEFAIFNSLIKSDSTFLDKVGTLNLELHDNIYPDLDLDRTAIKEFISKFESLNVIYQD